MRLEDLNAMDAGAASRELLKCCGSPRWAQRLADRRPFPDVEAMAAAADSVFDTLGHQDWLDAFAAHPKIGAGRIASNRRSATASAGTEDEWPVQEQAGVADAGDATLARLADINRDYEARFGYIFIVCATGQTAVEMLDMLERRMGNAPETELRIAASEQRKITHLRLLRLVDGKQDMTR